MKKYIHHLSDCRYLKTALLGAASVPLLVGGIVPTAQATEPCGDFGECKVLIEINSTDGDIGFHWLADGDDLKSTTILDPNYKLVYNNKAIGPLRKQKLTETFGESAEPLCWEDPEADPEDLENIVTLADFIERWADGTYTITGWSDGKRRWSDGKRRWLDGKRRWSDGERLYGETELTYDLPAAPQELDILGSTISWQYGTDLGNCTPPGEYPDGVRVLDKNEIDAYEVVLEPDVEDGDPIGNLIYTIRVPSNITAVTVPPEYLASLPPNTPVKFEVGAIGGEDNATFTEKDGFCKNGEVIEVCEEE